MCVRNYFRLPLSNGTKFLVGLSTERLDQIGLMKKLAYYSISLVLVLFVFILVSNITPVSAAPKNFSISANPTSLTTMAEALESYLAAKKSAEFWNGRLASAIGNR